MSRAILAFALAVLVVACDPSTGDPDGGGGGGGGGDAGNDAGTDGGVDPGTPSILGVTPASGSTIGTGTAIVITFSEAMAANSLALDGTLASSASPTWTSSTVLTISPTSTWAPTPNASTPDTLTIFATSSNGVALASTASLSYRVDGNAPQVALASPGSGEELGMGQAIVIQFDESVSPASLAGFDGTLAGAVGATVFSQRVFPNDTLAISPASAWPDGAGHTLSLRAGITDVFGNAAGSHDLTFDVDAIVPTLITAVPADGSLLNHDDGLQLTFSEPLYDDPSGHRLLSSTLVGGSGVTLAVSGATLTLTPNTFWNTDSGRTLQLEVRDAAGNLSAPITLTYDVVDGAIYAHPSGEDLNPGTRSEPKLTLTAALSTAGSNGLGEVRVAAGTYNQNVTVPTGVSLLGGYDPASWDTAPSRTAFPTVITEPRAGSVLYTVALSPNSGLERFHVVTSNGGINTCAAVSLNSSTTGTQRVIDNELEARTCFDSNNIRATNDILNLEIRGNRMISSGTPTNHNAVRLLLNAGAVPNILLEGNDILVSTTAVLSRGVEVNANQSIPSAATITLRNNFIRGGAGVGNASITGESWGCDLKLNNATYLIERNRIHGGTGANSTRGVYVTGSNVTTTLLGNTIYGGEPQLNVKFSYGAQISGTANIWNNAISGGGRVDPSITSGESNALELFAPNASVINNTLHHGFLNRGAAIRNNSGGVILRNNIFLSGGALAGGLVIAVREMNTGADFAELRNNRWDGFGDSGHFRFQDHVASGGSCPGFPTYNCLSSASDLNNAALTTQGAAGTAGSNTVGSADFVDVDGADNQLKTLFDANGVIENQWSLTSGSVIKASGIDGSASGANFGFGDDLTGALRTGDGATGWSIGAYEVD